jgi:hypothetical protein
MSDTLTPRQRLLDVLCGDLNVQGWDLKPKVWFVVGEPDDEYLEFHEEFETDPNAYFGQLALTHTLRENVTGLVVMTEGWAYPEALQNSFKTPQAQQAYWRLMPPAEHPDRLETRSLLFTSKDGSVLSMLAFRDGKVATKWSEMKPEQDAPSGNALIDMMLAILGHNATLMNTLNNVNEQIVKPLLDLGKVLERGADEGWSASQISVEILRSVPPEIRKNMIDTMPPEVREQMMQDLTPEQLREFGL